MGDLTDALMQVMIDTANEVSEDIVQDARDRISESYPPSSDPGTPPHRRSGDLYESIFAAVGVDGNTVSIECGSDLDYAELLEDGTDTMSPRPMWEGLQQDWEGFLKDRLATNIGSHFSA